MSPIIPELTEVRTRVEDFNTFARDFLLDDLPICEISVVESIDEDVNYDRAEIKDSIFKNCGFFHCTFENATFVDVLFQSCDFSGSKFTGAYFERCQFDSCKCLGVDMSNTILKNVSVQQSKLTYSNFDKTRMTDVFFDQVDFTEASISEARLKGFLAVNSIFRRNNFFKTSLSKIDFTANEFIAPILSSPPTELKGATINMLQATDLIKLWGVKVSET